jgi:hypothetical protein
VDDPHPGWGVTTATLSRYDRTRHVWETPAPSLSWLETDSIGSAATITLNPDREVFAVAVTWPAVVSVQSVTFTYQGPGSPTPSATSGGLAPSARFSPLPAAQVTSWAPATKNPSTIQSGQFWVAPAQVSRFPVVGSPTDRWRVLPWAWPLGEYKVTVRAGGSTHTMTLSLQPLP